MSVDYENPFVYNRPLTSDELIDREREVEELVSFARGGHNSRLSAPRRYGKTTLLYKVLEEADKQGMATAYVDLYGVVSVPGINRRIGEAYQGNIETRSQQRLGELARAQPEVSVGVPGVKLKFDLSPESDPMLLMHRLLDFPVVLHQKTGKRSLIVFDEFQDILRVDETTLDEKIDGLMRSHIQHQLREASYIFAGSHPSLMNELFGSPTRAFYEQACVMRLQPLDREYLGGYISDRFARTGRDVGECLGLLLELVAGHPQRAMFVANHLWRLTEPGESADQSVWEQAVAHVYGDLGELFEQTWWSFTELEQEILIATALGKLPVPQVSELSEIEVEGACRALIGVGVLIRGADKRLEFVDPLFANWVRSGRSSPAVDCKTSSAVLSCLQK